MLPLLIDENSDHRIIRGLRLQRFRSTPERVRDGALMFGVIVVPEDLAIGTAIEELAILIEYSATREFENLIIYLPI